MLFLVQDIGDDFLGPEFQMLPLHQPADLRKKEVDKISEKGFQQELEQLIVFVARNLFRVF
ncbi:MAG: hypothetical protein DDT29_01745 [Dehalococcoidia bacterium]|nr:hypothetical protein [Bacillota bacterium]